MDVFNRQDALHAFRAMPRPGTVFPPEAIDEEDELAARLVPPHFRNRKHGILSEG